jgi:hypothetical protein
VISWTPERCLGRLICCWAFDLSFDMSFNRILTLFGRCTMIRLVYQNMSMSNGLSRRFITELTGVVHLLVVPTSNSLVHPAVKPVTIRKLNALICRFSVAARRPWSRPCKVPHRGG